MKLIVRDSAARALARLQPKSAQGIIAAMQVIAADPFGRHPQALPLSGKPGWYRLRRGDWRALYRIDRAVDAVVLEDVLKREEAYR